MTQPTTEQGTPGSIPEAAELGAIPEDRRRSIADLLLATGAVTVSQVETRFGVSAMTARRDLGELERRGLARRTHGGAVLPNAAGHEDSFDRRLNVATAPSTTPARMEPPPTIESPWK